MRKLLAVLALVGVIATTHTPPRPPCSPVRFCHPHVPNPSPRPGPR